MPGESVGFGQVAAHSIWPAACSYLLLKVLRNCHDTASVSFSRGSTNAPFCYFRSRPDRHRGYRFPSRASRNCSRVRERLLRLPPVAGRIDAEIHDQQVDGYDCARCLHPASCRQGDACPVKNYSDCLRWQGPSFGGECSPACVYCAGAHLKKCPTQATHPPHRKSSSIENCLSSKRPFFGIGEIITADIGLGFLDPPA